MSLIVIFYFLIMFFCDISGLRPWKSSLFRVIRSLPISSITQNFYYPQWIQHSSIIFPKIPYHVVYSTKLFSDSNEIKFNLSCAAASEDIGKLEKAKNDVQTSEDIGSSHSSAPNASTTQSTANSDNIHSTVSLDMQSQLDINLKNYSKYKHNFEPSELSFLDSHQQKIYSNYFNHLHAAISNSTTFSDNNEDNNYNNKEKASALWEKPRDSSLEKSIRKLRHTEEREDLLYGQSLQSLRDEMVADVELILQDISPVKKPRQKRQPKTVAMVTPEDSISTAMMDEGERK